jgi:very-short-patch-repair endonuclease
VGRFVLDFYAPEVKLGIELDGESHCVDGAREKDSRRQEYIELFGIKIPPLF